MKKLLFLVVIGFTLAVFGYNPEGSYRWNTMPAGVRSNVLEQVTIRRTDERLVVLRKSMIDRFRQKPIKLPEADGTVRTYLEIMDIEGVRVHSDIYPWLGAPNRDEDGVFVYVRYSKYEGRMCTSFWLPVEQYMLCILDRVYQPLPRIEERIHEIWRGKEQFCEDHWRLPTDQLVKKYGLVEIFSNAVYRIRSKCMMVVDYPSSEDNDIFIYKREDGVLDWHYEVDRRMIERRKRMGKGLIGYQHMLILSQEEASELVALVGHQWYYGDDSKYREMRREYPWFQPVDVAHPKTQLGKDLKATIEAKKRARQK